MTTFDNPSISQYIVYKLGKAITARKEAKETSGIRARTWVQTISRLILQLAGFACLTYAGFTVSITAGWIVAGISAFVLSWLINGAPAANRPQPTVDPMANRR